MKFVPLNVHAFCAHGSCSWTLAFGSRGGGLSLWLAYADGGAAAHVIADISTPRQIDAIVERIADLTMPTRTVAIELFDLLSTLAGESIDDNCTEFLIARMDEWIARTRQARVVRGNVA
jgi:hypothetical protein